MVVVLAVKFWVVVPENLRTQKNACRHGVCVCVGGGGATRHEALWKGGWGKLYLGPRRVTDTKQNCPCYEHFTEHALSGPTARPPLSRYSRSLPNDNKISDNRIRKIPKFIVMEYPRKKTASLNNFPYIFPLPNPLQNANFINIVVSASLILGIAIPIAPMSFRVSQGIALYPPKFVLLQPEGGGGRRYRSSSCPLKGITLYGGIAVERPVGEHHYSRNRRIRFEPPKSLSVVEINWNSRNQGRICIYN